MYYIDINSAWKRVESKQLWMCDWMIQTMKTLQKKHEIGVHYAQIVIAARWRAQPGTFL